MSTKIYNAYKLPKMDMAKFFAMVAKLKKEVYKAQLKKYKEEVAEICLEMFDHQTIYPGSKVHFEKTYFSEGSEIVRDGIAEHSLEQKQRHAQKDEKMDNFYFHVHFLFYKGRIYALTHAYPNMDYHKVLKRVAKAELYEYWDNTDEPKGLTRAQFKARGREWDKVLQNKSNPSDAASVKVEFPFNIGLERMHDHKFNIPTKKLSNPNRVKNIASNIALKNHFTVWPKDYQEVFSYMSTDDFFAARKAEAEKLLKILKTPTKEELFNEKVTITKKKNEEGELKHFYVVII